MTSSPEKRCEGDHATYTSVKLRLPTAGYVQLRPSSGRSPGTGGDFLLLVHLT